MFVCLSKPASLFQLHWWRESKHRGIRRGIDCDSWFGFWLKHWLTNPNCCGWPYHTLSFMSTHTHASISFLLQSPSADLNLHFTHLADAFICNLHLGFLMRSVHYLKLLTVATTLESICSAFTLSGKTVFLLGCELKTQRTWDSDIFHKVNFESSLL